MNHPIKIADSLWNHATGLIEPPQFCFVVVSDPHGVGTGTLAFRHNCETIEGLVAALRELADKLEAGEARPALALVPHG